MRKTAAALISLGLAAVALAGCSGAPTFDGKACPTKSESTSLSDSVAVKGAFGSEPKVEVTTPLHVKKTSVDALITGTGTARAIRGGP